MAGMLLWIIDDTRALIADVRRLARRFTSRWQWLRVRSERRLADAAAEAENVKRSAWTHTRMCRECRALIPSDARVCPECGESPGPRPATGLARVARNMLPGVVSVTSIILTINMLLYGVSLMVDARLAAGGAPGPLTGHSWFLTLTSLGANVPALVSQGEIWRLLTMVFLHGGLLHILFNSWALLAVGPLVEDLYGPRKFLFLYVATGIGGSVLSFLWRFGQFGPGIGASGALFGLIGIAAVWGWRRGGSIGAGVRGQMVQWAIYGLLMGVLFRFDNAAHLGGLITGALLALAVGEGEPRGAAAGRFWEALSWLSALLVLGSFVMVGLRYQATLDIMIQGLLQSGP